MPSLSFRSLCSKLRQAILDLSPEARASLGKSATRFLAGSPVNATDFLRLCALHGINPRTGEVTASNGAVFDADFSFDLLGAGLAIKRHSVERGKASIGISQRVLARRIGLSLATVVRIEQGKPVSIESVLKACAFIGVHPFHYMANEKRRAA